MKAALTFFALFFCLSALSQSGSLDTQFNSEATLTDQQINDSKTFVHQAKKDEYLKKECQAKSQDNCKEPAEGFEIEQIIGKAYALVYGTIIDGGNKLTKKPAAPKEGAVSATEPSTGKPSADKNVKEKEEMDDYCMYGAIAYETLGGMIQQLLQKKGTEDAQAASDPQLQALVGLREAHKARAKTATFQSGVYGVIAGCYIGMYASMGAAADTKFFLKLGASTTLATMYGLKAKKHNEYADKAQEIINGMPKAGDCNPWTQTSCFCVEKSSKTAYPAQYKEVCEINGGNFNPAKVATGCAAVQDGKTTFDQSCSCKKTNTCLKMNLSFKGANFTNAKSFMNEMAKGTSLLNSGSIDQAQLAANSAALTALASRLKPKGKLSLNTGVLSPEEKKIASILTNVPSEVAAVIAKAPVYNPSKGGVMDTKSYTASLIQKLPEKLKNDLKSVEARYKSNGSSNNSTAEKEDDFNLNFGAPQPEVQAENSIEMVQFAEKAYSNADVSSAPETPIFDIISNRYRKSGWTRLDSTFK